MPPDQAADDAIETAVATTPKEILEAARAATKRDGFDASPWDLCLVGQCRFAAGLPAMPAMPPLRANYATDVEGEANEALAEALRALDEAAGHPGHHYPGRGAELVALDDKHETNTRFALRLYDKAIASLK